MVFTSWGNLSSRLQKYDEAISCLEKARKISKKINNQVGLAMIHFSIGKCLLSKREKEKAVIELVNSFKINEKLKIKRGIGIVAPMLLRTLLDTQRKKEAKDFYKRAINICPKDRKLLALRGCWTGLRDGTGLRDVP